MKRIVLTLIAGLMVFTLTSQNIIKLAPQIIVVNLGPKNPNFDEDIFPHLKFVYTPNIKAVITDENDINKSYQIEGTPEFLTNAFNNKQIKEYGFMLFDKNGICYTEGNDIMQDVDISQTVCSNAKTLGENLKNVVKKGKTAKIKTEPLPEGKPKVHVKIGFSHTDVTKAPYLTGHPLPDDFILETSQDKEVSLESLIKGKPTLVFFIYIPPKAALQTLNKYYKGSEPKPSKAIQKKYIKDVLYLEMLEGQFFDFNPKKAMKKKYGKK